MSALHVPALVRVRRGKTYYGAVLEWPDRRGWTQSQTAWHPSRGALDSNLIDYRTLWGARPILILRCKLKDDLDAL